MKTYGPYRPEIAPRGRSPCDLPQPYYGTAWGSSGSNGPEVSPSGCFSYCGPLGWAPTYREEESHQRRRWTRWSPSPEDAKSRCAPSRGRRIRLHVYKHFPEGMCPHTPDGPSGNDLAHWRVAVLRRLAEFLTGVPQLENLCCLLDEQWHDPVREVTPPIAEGNPGLKLENDVETAPPQSLSSPFAAPAALLHWRPFAFLFSFLSSEEKKELHFGRRGGGE